MKRVLIGISTLALVLVTTTAAEAVTVNGKCAKAGAKAKAGRVLVVCKTRTVVVGSKRVVTLTWQPVKAAGPAVAPTSSATPAPTVSRDPLHAFPELEALLPTSVAGVPFKRWSALAAPNAGLESLAGGSLSSAPAAEVAVTSDGKGSSVNVFRVSGESQTSLKSRMRTEVSNYIVGTIDGREVLAGRGANRSLVYIYVKGSMVFVVVAQASLATALLKALP